MIYGGLNMACQWRHLVRIKAINQFPGVGGSGTLACSANPDGPLTFSMPSKPFGRNYGR